MSSVRLRRITADFEKLTAYVQQHPRVRVLQTQGDPPESYQVEFRLKSLRQSNGRLVEAKEHVAEIALPRNYPRTPPVCRMLTPIFHPNIAPHAICVGDHWSAGEPLWGIVARIGEMIAFQSYNTKSPLNGEAARWVDENVARLPLDVVSMMPDKAPGLSGPPGMGSQSTMSRSQDQKTPTPDPSPEDGGGGTGEGPAADATPASDAVPSRFSFKPASQPVGAATRIPVACPKCQRRYLVPPQAASHQVRCKQCQTIIQVPPLRGGN